MKKLLIILFIFSLPEISYSQVLMPYRIVDFGGGASLNTVLGDTESFKKTLAIHVSCSYNLDIYTAMIAEIQFGQLAGGDSVASFSGRQFTNKFNSFCVRGQMQIGKIFSGLPEKVQRFYVSSGIGGISNNITSISRSSIKIANYSTPGKDQSINFFVPLRAGFEYPIKNAFNQSIIKFDLGYQYNLILGDDIDGFTAGSLKDKVSQISIGIKMGIYGRKW